MTSRTITLPRLGMIAVTRAALGAGVALLAGERLDRKPRRAVGWALLGVGVLSTVPLIAVVVRHGVQPILPLTRWRRVRKSCQCQDATFEGGAP